MQVFEIWAKAKLNTENIKRSNLVAVALGSARVRGCNHTFPDWPPERELQMVQLSATSCSCIAILWVSLVSFAAITLCVASYRAFFVVSVHIVIDSVRKLLDTPLYTAWSAVSSNLRIWSGARHQDEITDWLTSQSDFDCHSFRP
jgi:hypothetical protein